MVISAASCHSSRFSSGGVVSHASTVIHMSSSRIADRRTATNPCSALDASGAAWTRPLWYGRAVVRGITPGTATVNSPYSMLSRCRERSAGRGAAEAMEASPRARGGVVPSYYEARASGDRHGRCPCSSSGCTASALSPEARASVSPPAPMVLPGKLGGRVGCCRGTHQQRHRKAALLMFHGFPPHRGRVLDSWMCDLVGR